MKKLLLLTLLLLSVTMTGIAQKAKNVTVTNADDFIKAIASNTNITLKINGTLTITNALNKLPEERNIDDLEWEERKNLAPGVYYVNEYDGRAIVIANINNLTITGGGAELTHIQATPSYAEVLFFAYCNNVTIKNIKAGHVETGTCTGDVVFFYHCKNVLLEKCDLYGCGVNGIALTSCNDVTVNKTEIHDCSEDYAIIFSSNNVLFNECIMRDCGGSLNVDDESTVDYQKCDIEYKEEYGDYDDYEGEGDYGYEGGCPQDLMEAMNGSGEVFKKKLNNCDVTNGVIYEVLGEYEGHVVIPEMDGWFAAYIPQALGDGEYDFLFLDNVNTNVGEKMFFGNGHIIVVKKTGVFSYEIEENKLKSVTSITGNDGNDFSHGKDKNSLKKCTKAEAEPHFEFEATDVQDVLETDEVYPWG